MDTVVISSNEIQVSVLCPHCGALHYHRRDVGNDEARKAHCGLGEYYLIEPVAKPAPMQHTHPPRLYRAGCNPWRAWNEYRSPRCGINAALNLKETQL